MPVERKHVATATPIEFGAVPIQTPPLREMLSLQTQVSRRGTLPQQNNLVTQLASEQEHPSDTGKYMEGFGIIQADPSKPGEANKKTSVRGFVTSDKGDEVDLYDTGPDRHDWNGKLIPPVNGTTYPNIPKKNLQEAEVPTDSAGNAEAVRDMLGVGEKKQEYKTHHNTDE